MSGQVEGSLQLLYSMSHCTLCDVLPWRLLRESQSAFFLSYSALVYFTLAGCPITTTFGGTSFVTTAAIAITLSLPTLTPGFITALLPIIAPSSTTTPLILGLMG